MTYEIMAQASARIKHHLYMKERTHKDIAVPRMSEKAMFAG